MSNQIYCIKFVFLAFLQHTYYILSNCFEMDKFLNNICQIFRHLNFSILNIDKKGVKWQKFCNLFCNIVEILLANIIL